MCQPLSALHMLKKFYPSLLGSWGSAANFAGSVFHKWKTCTLNFFGVNRTQKRLETMQNHPSRRIFGESCNFILQCMRFGLSQVPPQPASEYKYWHCNLIWMHKLVCSHAWCCTMVWAAVAGNFQRWKDRRSLVLELTVAACRMRLRKASFWARSAQTAPLRHLFFGAAGYTGQARHTCCNSCVLSCWAWVSMSVDQDAGLISAQAIRLQLGPMAARWKEAPVALLGSVSATPCQHNWRPTAWWSSCAFPWSKSWMTLECAQDALQFCGTAT